MPCSGEGVSRASSAVRAGAVIVFPTDTVYGLGCDPYNAAALGRIYGMKRRPRSKALPVLGLRRDIERVARLDGLSARVADRFWPGPVTLVLPLRDERLADALGSPDAAMREPGGACAHDLLAACGLLAGTSANRSGNQAPSEPGPGIPEGYDVLVDGGPAGGSPSTVVDCARRLILRHGAAARDVEAML